MAVSPTAIESAMVVPSDPIWRLSVAQYHLMIEAGILTDDDPVELLEGWLVTKMPKNRRHSLATQLTREALSQVMTAGWYVDDQEPITLENSEPEPDVIVVRGSRRDYTDRQPNGSEVGLVVEVADATLSRDRTLKLRIYAQARIPVYWIVNLQQNQIEVYSDPVGDGDQATYQQQVIYTTTGALPVIIDGQQIAQISVNTLLP